jgi:hypothetical protein
MNTLASAWMYFLSLCVFVIVLFFYIHIMFHLKTSEDLEVFQLDNLPAKDRFEEICDLKQPVLFPLEEGRGITFETSIKRLDEYYGAFDVKIRQNIYADEKKEMYLPLSLKEAVQLVVHDPKHDYFSEENGDFLNETGVVKRIRREDTFYRPPMCARNRYDVLIGNKSITPLRHNLDYRTYLMVSHGTAKVKLISPHYTRYLDLIKDYDNMEFRTEYDYAAYIWNSTQNFPQHKMSNLSKVKTLEVSLNPNNVLYIPAYWWYSIQFDELTSITVLKYQTYMNILAILNHYAQYWLQQQNIKEDIMIHKITTSPAEDTQTTPPIPYP